MTMKDTQKKMRTESKHVSTKKIYKTQRKNSKRAGGELQENSEFFCINSYFKFKYIKLLIKRHTVTK